LERFWYILGHLVNFPAIWYILWQYIFGYLVYFPHFGTLFHEKSGNLAVAPLFLLNSTLLSSLMPEKSGPVFRTRSRIFPFGDSIVPGAQNVERKKHLNKKKLEQQIAALF
jgi:hypothetical protein